MGMNIVYECNKVEWEAVATTLCAVGMAFHSPQKHKRAFEASYATVFVYEKGHLIGFGRALSDGEYQAAIYDCAVVANHQGRGVGSLIVRELIKQVPDCNIILYASPGKEGFYQKHSFRKMKTAMGLFTDSKNKIEQGFTE